MWFSTLIKERNFNPTPEEKHYTGLTQETTNASLTFAYPRPSNSKAVVIKVPSLISNENSIDYIAHTYSQHTAQGYLFYETFLLMVEEEVLITF